MWFLQFMMVVNLAFITYQDIKQREVLWLLFPLAAIFMGANYYMQTTRIAFAINSLMNLGVIAIVLGTLFLYAKFKLKKPFLQEAFGLGDAFFFTAFAFGFPFVTFIVLFVFSLLFSLVMSLIVNRKKEEITIPLAGYMAVFLIAVFGFSWTIDGVNLYMI